MRRSALLPLLLLAFTHDPVEGGVLEIDASIPGHDPPVHVSWILHFPDTLADTDTRAILESLAPDKGPPLLPRGRLTAGEEVFLVGLRAVMDGAPRTAVQHWASLRPQTLAPELRGSLRVNAGVLLALQGETGNAEANWTDQLHAGGSARDAAWRNLLSLYLAQRRHLEAGTLIDAVLTKEPGNRLALLAKAAYIRQFGSRAEWEDFLRVQAGAADASPDMQLAWGEWLEEHGRLEEAVRFLDRGLAKLPGAGRGWFLLARAHYRQSYFYFAIDALQNAGRAGYQSPDFYELYARVLHACCTGDEDARAVRARTAAEELLVKGLEQDIHRRSMAQLLYHLYSLNGKPEAARALRRSLWFHFEGPRRDIPPLRDPAWDGGFGERPMLSVTPGIHSLTWMLAMRESDVYRFTAPGNSAEP